MKQQIVFSAVLGLFVALLVALMLYGAEAYLAYEEYDIERGTGGRIRMAAAKAGAPFDARQQEDVIRDLRAQGKDAYASMGPGVFYDTDGISVAGQHLFPLSNISRTTAVLCNEMGEWSVYEADEHGFNNPPGQWRRGEVDVAIAGSSFIVGGCLKPGDDIASQLRRRGLRTLNVGMGASGPLVYNATIREYLAPVAPKYVIFTLYAVNIRDTVYEKVAPSLMRYLDDRNFSQHLFERQAEVDVLLRSYLGGDYEKRLQQLGAQRKERQRVVTERLIYGGLRLKKLRERVALWGAHPVVEEGREEEKLGLFERALLSAKEAVEKGGGTFVFMYLPDWYTYAAEYDTYGIKIGKNFLLHQDVLAIVRKHKIPVIDIQTEVFDKHPDPVSLWNFRMFGHYTPAGYTLIANRIADFLRENTNLSLR